MLRDVYSGYARIASIVLLLITPALLAEVVLGPWHIRHPHPTNFPRSLVHDGEKFVMVDFYGNIFTSISGRNWTLHRPPIVRPLTSIAYGSNTFAVVGNAGTFLTSTNGTNWASIETSTPDNLSKVIFTGDQFVAVGDHGTILSVSLSGETVVHPAITTNRLHDITGGPGTLVAAGDRATILVSTNFAEWKRAVVAATNDFRSIAYFRGSYHNGWFMSSDPMQWTNKIPYDPYRTVVFSLATNSYSIARAYGGYIETSGGGTTFFRYDVPQRTYRLTTISNEFVALSGGVFFSTEGQFKLVTPEPLPRYFSSISADTNGYVAFSPFLNLRFISTNGQAWRLKRPEDPEIATNDLAFAKLPFAQAGRNATIRVTDDGVQWKDIPKPRFGYPLHAAALGNVIVASGVSELWATTDRTNWVMLMSKLGPPDPSAGNPEGGGQFETYPWVSSINVSSNLLVATTVWGELLLSTNGLDWQVEQTPFMLLDDATFTPTGLLVCSSDLIAETRFDNAPDHPFPATLAVAANRVMFDAPHRYYELQSSSNLTDWQTLLTTSTNTSFDLTVTNTARSFFRAVAPY